MQIVYLITGIGFVVKRCNNSLNKMLWMGIQLNGVLSIVLRIVFGVARHKQRLWR